MSLNTESVLKALRNVKVPSSRLDIVEAKQISHLEVEGDSCVLEISLPESNPVFEKSLQFQIEAAIKALSAQAQVVIGFKAAGQNPVSKFGAMIAVGSGKGGVGKSSVTVNLAAAFQRMGYKVGILDCDFYGPSIPTMLGVADKKPMMMDGKIQPIEAFDMKVMSAGFLIEPGQSLVWRGPMIHKLIQQFVHDVDWTGVDVLLVDLPPGTGDAPLSLSQTMPLTGAVMVSMPSHLSIIDVHKGISMFHQVKVPILGIVENMSHYECTSCHHKEEIFDHGRVQKFCTELNVTYLGDIPIDPKIRALSDEGRPFLLDFPESQAGQAIQAIAKRLQPFVRSAGDEDESIRVIL